MSFHPPVPVLFDCYKNLLLQDVYTVGVRGQKSYLTTLQDLWSRPEIPPTTKFAGDKNQLIDTDTKSAPSAIRKNSSFLINNDFIFYLNSYETFYIIRVFNI